MNDLIKNVADAGLSNTVYYAFHVLGFLSNIIFAFFYARKFQVKPRHGLIIILFTWLIGYGWVYVLAWAENLFTFWGMNNIVRAFIWFPLIAYLPIRLLKVDPLKGFDIIAPCMPLAQAIPHIGCIFAGCCCGYHTQSAIGIYNPVLDDVLFPIQLLESLVAFIIFLICIYYSKREHYRGSGRVFPLFLILFGSTRFFLEFLRHNDKVFAGISILAFHAALMVVVGVLWWIWLHKKRPFPKA